jgi:predicted ATP-grasp superfamily ATP-dependent carboligase
MPGKILLTTTVGWASVARLAHGFAAASCQVDAHAPRDALVFASRYVSGRHTYRALSPVDSLRQAVEESGPDLLVACDDRAVRHILELHSEANGDAPDIARLIERSLGEPSRYPGLMSRSGFMARAKSLGIRAPATREISVAHDLDAFIRDFGLPIVLKADGTWGGDGVVVARSAAEAHAAWHKLGQAPSRLRSLARAARRRDAHHLAAAISPKPSVVSAQQFVPGSPAASAFACWKGEIVGAIYYDVIVAEGEIGPPNVIRRIDCPQMEAASRNVARHHDLSGIHGMDFLRDPSGSVHLIEINPRVTQGSTLAFGPGRDLPAALAACLGPGAGMRNAIVGDTVAIFPREWQRDPASPWLRAAHHDVPWDDPGVLLGALRGMQLQAERPKPTESIAA